MPDFLYVDIETIPTGDDAVKAHIDANIKPPAQMKKAETIAAWEENEKPNAVAEAIAKTSFDGAYGRVCCIGWAWNDRQASCDIEFSSGTHDEKMGLLFFFAAADHLRPRGGDVVIVGHNVLGFDIRMITQRAMVLGVKLPAWWPINPRPWSENVHDTMLMWAGHNGTVSLDRLARALGLEGKGNIDGSMVAGMFERGEYEEIAEYCVQDVERVRAVHRKMLAVIGDR